MERQKKYTFMGKTCMENFKTFKLKEHFVTKLKVEHLKIEDKCKQLKTIFIFISFKDNKFHLVHDKP